MKLTDCDLHGKAGAQHDLVAVFGDIEIEPRFGRDVHFDLNDVSIDGIDEKRLLLEPHMEIGRVNPGSGQISYASCEVDQGRERKKLDVGILIVQREKIALAICLAPAGKMTSDVKKVIGWAGPDDFQAPSIAA